MLLSPNLIVWSFISLDSLLVDVLGAGETTEAIDTATVLPSIMPVRL